jgi:hypothetical protein
MREGCNDSRNSFIRQVKGPKRDGLSRLNTAETTGWNKNGLLVEQPLFQEISEESGGRGSGVTGEPDGCLDAPKR